MSLRQRTNAKHCRDLENVARKHLQEIYFLFHFHEDNRLSVVRGLSGKIVEDMSTRASATVSRLIFDEQ